MAKTTITCPQCSAHINIGGVFKDLPETEICPVCKTVVDVKSVMAKHDESKKGLISVIKYEGGNDTFIWKHPIEDFNFGSQLIVHESQEAIFFRDGQALDTFGPGRYTLDTQNLPILRELMSLSINVDSRFHSEVYFINKTVQMAVKWGTPDKVRFIDPLTGTPLQIGVSGEMNLSVSNSRKLLIKLVGTTTGIAWGDDGNGFTKSLQKSFRPLISNAVKTNLSAVIKNNNIDLLEIDEKLDLISDDLKNKILPGFEEYGLTIPQFYVTSVLLPEDDSNFKQIRKLHTITLQTRMAQAEEESTAAIESAHREAELQRQLTETEIAKREAERRIIEAQADAAAMRMQGMTEAEIMQAKGYNQKDVLQAEVQKAYAEGIGNMNISGGSGGVMGDILGMGVGLSMTGQIAPQISNMFGGMNPSGQLTQQTAPTIPATDTWKCSCGNTATGMFCNACGNKKPEPKADTWKCNCGNIATGMFCNACGSKKPEQKTWDCSCGNKGIVGMFCNMCGAKKPDNSKWDCSCGNKGITGNFCNNCGKKRSE